MPGDNDSLYQLWRTFYKAIGLAVFLLLLAPIYWAFELSGHHDVFKRFAVLIVVVVVVPASYLVMEGIERRAFGRKEHEPLSTFLKVAIGIGAVVAVVLAVFSAM